MFKGFIVLIGFVVISFEILGCGFSPTSTETTKLPYQYKSPPQQLTIAEYKQEVKLYTDKIESFILEFDNSFIYVQKRMSQRTPDEILKQGRNNFHDNELFGLAVKNKKDIEKLSHDLYLLEERSRNFPNLYLQSSQGSLMAMIRAIERDNMSETKHDLEGAKSAYKRFQKDLERLP